MILANFISGWFGRWGLYVAAGALSGYLLPHDPIQGLALIGAVLAVGSFFLTLLIEAPFGWLGLRKTAVSRRRGCVAFILAQAISYAALAALYFSATDASFIRAFSGVEHPAQIYGAQGWLYYLNREQDTIYRRRLGIDFHGAEDEKVGRVVGGAGRGDLRLYPIRNEHPYIGLVTRRIEQPYGTEPVRIELPGRIPSSHHRGSIYAADPKKITVGTNGRIVQCEGDPGQLISLHPTPEEVRFRCWIPSNSWGSFRISEVRDWPSPTRPDDFWGTDYRWGTPYRVETPFAFYWFSNITYIAPSIVLIQMGDWILMLDLETRRAATVCRGVGPLVVLD